MNRATLTLSAIVLLCGSLPSAAAPRCDPDKPSVPAGALGELGCKPRRPAARSPQTVEPRAEPGRIDFGNGTEVRIGGRVRAEAETRR